jgi:molybdenum cofactor guanylyltransferase
MCGSFAARQSRWATKTTEELLVANQKTATVTTEASGVPGILLAGGLARRMGGGDKPLREIGGRTILARVIGRLTPQCECLALSANGDPSRFASFGLPVVADGVKNYPGPLAGILAGLDWAAARRPNAQWIVSAPGDCPFLPRDLVVRLREAVSAQGAELAVAASQGRSHPVIGLWSVALRDALRQALVVEGLRKVDEWVGRYRVATVAWAAEPLDPFFNANTVEDLAKAERLAVIEDPT